MKRLERMAREGVASSLTKTPTYPKRLSHRRFPKPLSLSCRSLLSIFLFFCFFRTCTEYRVLGITFLGFLHSFRDPFSFG